MHPSESVWHFGVCLCLVPRQRKAMGKKTAPWVWLWPAAGRRRHFTKEPVLQRFLANSLKKQQGSLSLHRPYAYPHLSSIASQSNPAHHHGAALGRDWEGRIRNNKWADFFFSQECFQPESHNSSELCLHAKFEPKLLTTVANSLSSCHGPLLLPLILPEKCPKSVSEGDAGVFEITLSNLLSLSPADPLCQDLFKHTIRCFFCTECIFPLFFCLLPLIFLGKTCPSQPTSH